MEETSPNNTRVYFSGDTSEIISRILQKYNLEKTDEELGEEIFGEKPAFINGGAILETAISLVKRTISEEQLTSDLQKNLGVKKDIAEVLVKEIKANLVSIATTEKPATPPTPTQPVANEPPVGVVRAQSEQPKKINLERSAGEEIIPVPKQKTMPSKISSLEKNKERPKQPRGPDKYREPVG